MKRLKCRIKLWHEETCEAVQEEYLGEILEEPTTTTVKVKPHKPFNCFNTYIAWAEENDLSAKCIIIIRNMWEKMFSTLELRIIYFFKYACNM